MNVLTPIKAVRARCIDCSCGELKAVRECDFTKCPLHHLRMGEGSRAVLGSIGAYCIWCCNGQKGEVRRCPSVECALWVYRFGKRPKNAPPFDEIVTTAALFEESAVEQG